MGRLFGRGIFLAVFLFFTGAFCFAQGHVGISGTVKWDLMEISAELSLDLAGAGIRLPGGRLQGEALLSAEYLRLIRPEILGIQVDSSSTVADHILRGEWSFLELESLALQSRSVPPALSTDLGRLAASYALGISGLSRAFIRHRQPVEVPRTLSPVAAPAFTGIVIIASDELPVQGREGSALARPSLFPRVWDSRMNLIFERNMLDPSVDLMVRYFPREAIFAPVPSGLSPELAAIVGERPLRISARGLFGETPTDPIISLDDALLIISTAENRNLLRQGRVAIIVDDSLLRSSFAQR
ncbi:MAG: polymerase [Treponema sp.]|nr:polymerase [Treponema sp.]